MPVSSYPARFPGVCAKCGGTFGRGAPIKARWTYDKGAGKPVRQPGEYAHAECPKVYVDPKTGEVIDLMQRRFDGTEVNYDEAVRETSDVPVGAFRPRRKRLKLHPDQGLMFPKVDKKAEGA